MQTYYNVQQQNIPKNIYKLYVKLSYLFNDTWICSLLFKRLWVFYFYIDYIFILLLW